MNRGRPDRIHCNILCWRGGALVKVVVAMQKSGGFESCFRAKIDRTH